MNKLNTKWFTKKNIQRASSPTKKTHSAAAKVITNKIVVVEYYGNTKSRPYSIPISSEKQIKLVPERQIKLENQSQTKTAKNLRRSDQQTR